MLNRTLFTLLFLISFTVYSQKKITTDFNYKVTYNLSYSLDSTDLETKKSEDMILFLGDSISTFSSNAKLFKNSVIVKGNTAQTAKENMTDFPYVIVKNAKQNYLAYTLRIVEDYFYYEQKLDVFDWKLQEDTKVINGYQAQKATTTYSGRDYTAWFTLEIPISDGPYKFNGLPGLILELSDTENHYNFTLKGFEKLEKEISFKINLKQYIETDKEKLNEVWYRYRKDPFTYTNATNIKISPEVHQKYVKLFSEKLAKENNHIEKQ
ncbi:GLPGLI family protein [Winogradskyella wichelsiae]|uniref:GLPGLI family protein n=1 Tax=Winogradskyella wichelsiae TaxID=2697007 RepID=UPI003EF564D9